MRKNAELAATILSLVIFPTVIHAEGTLTFPDLQTSAHIQAAGRGASVRGVNALGTNPAALHSRHAEAFTQYQALLLNTSLTQASFSLPLKAFNATSAISYMAMESKDLDRRSSLGENTGVFSSRDQMVGLSLSRPFSPAGRSFLWGASVKFYQFNIDSSHARTHALDLGLHYDFEHAPMTLGAAALNLGPGAVFNERENALPRKYALTGNWGVNRLLSVNAAYVRHDVKNKNEFSMGTEVAVGQRLALRGRYAFLSGAGTESGGLGGLSAGFGMKILRENSLDYAFQPYDSSLKSEAGAGTHQVSMTFRWGHRGGR